MIDKIKAWVQKGIDNKWKPKEAGDKWKFHEVMGDVILFEYWYIACGEEGEYENSEHLEYCIEQLLLDPDFMKAVYGEETVCWSHGNCPNVGIARDECLNNSLGHRPPCYIKGYPAYMA